MDSYSGKRAVAPRNKSSGDETIQFCNRIGCSGRLNHTKPIQNSLRPSSFTKEQVTNVKKPLRESMKKLPSKRVGTIVEQGESSNTRLQNFYAQTASVDSLRRKTTLKGSRTGNTSSSVAGSRPSTNWTDYKGSGVSSVRTRRPVNQHGNNPSSVQTAPVPPDNVNAIANVLLALERIDQQEGFTYEQIPGSSFLGGFNYYDHHRDMRLDIDNMSYEELLALEDEMGVVSTSLSEEELSKCIRIGVYKPFDMNEWRMRDKLCFDDTKCSICQEEFIGGDDIGRVGCDHGYHAVCIKQWLRLKNWCPICKSSAKPSHS